MAFGEDDLIQLSALQHYAFCKRQCALIHIELVWEENWLTANGRILHEKVDTAKPESRGNIKIHYGLPIRSLKLGIVGKADVVEFHKKGNVWVPFPVEYKRGKPKSEDWDRIQLCAQAICLEEMLSINVPQGAIFYGKIKRREDVIFDTTLREKTTLTAMEARALIESGITPQAEYSSKCEQCSLLNFCLPRKNKQIHSYLAKAGYE